MKSSSVLLCVLCVLCGSIRSQEAKPAPIREKTVYVPYEKLEAVFEKEGRGIFLPYEEFLKLWEAAKPKPPDPKPDLPPAPAVVRSVVCTGTVKGEVARFEALVEIEGLKAGWSEVPILLKGVAVEEVTLSNPKALFSAKDGAYAVFLPEKGRCEAKLRFSARVAEEPGKKTLGFSLPAAGVTRLDLTIPEESPRIEVKPAIAVTQTPSKDKTTRVLAFLGNSPEVAVSWMPPAGKAVEGAAVAFAEVALRAFLGERVLRLGAGIQWQIVRGELDELRVHLPADARLLSVKGENIREWVTEGEVLIVRLHARVKDGYQLQLSFERILQETPPKIAIPFPRVEGVIRESGWLVVSHEAGLNVRPGARTGLGQIDREEMPEPLREGLAHGFRYLAHPLALDLDVERILPVVRARTASVIVLGREEDRWIGAVDYDIARAGLFRLELRVPERWSVESVGDPAAVEDHQSAVANGQRTIAVSLKSKAMGTFRLPFRLAATGSAKGGEATLGPPALLGISEDRGIFGVSAPRAFDLITVEAQGLLAADVDEILRSGLLAQAPADAGAPLCYRYREGPGTVRVRLDPRQTEIDVLAQHLVEITDGAIRLTHLLDFEILYAAADRLSFTAPSSLDAILKVEAKEKKEVKKVSTADGRTTWEILLQGPALGAVSVTLTHELELKGLVEGKPFPYPVPLVHAVGARAEKGFVALRKEGTLEVVPAPKGLEAIDAASLPDKLRRGGIYGAFRYFAPGASIDLTLTKYDHQTLAVTVVNLLHLKSILSEERKLKTRATLLVQNTERQHLEIGLPKSAAILSISVNGKPEPPRKRKDSPGTLIQIPASRGAAGIFPVVIVYEESLSESGMGSLGSVAIDGPEILGANDPLGAVPIAKTEAELYLPPGYAYLGFGGSLRLKEAGAPDLWSRFQEILGRLTGNGGAEAAGRAPVQSARQALQSISPVAPGSIDIDLPTRDQVEFDFSTLAPRGTVRFIFVGRSLLSAIDVAALVFAFLAGWLLWRRAHWPLCRTGAVVAAIPLAAAWFARGAAAEIVNSLLAGGVLFVAWRVLVAGRDRWRESRVARVKFAPDPFLEEAKSAPKPPSTPSPTPAAGEEKKP